MEVPYLLSKFSVGGIQRAVVQHLLAKLDVLLEDVAQTEAYRFAYLAEEVKEGRRPVYTSETKLTCVYLRTR